MASVIGDAGTSQKPLEGTKLVVPEMADVVTLNAGLALHLSPLREHAEVLPDPDPRRHAGRVRASLAVGGGLPLQAR